MKNPFKFFKSSADKKAVNPEPVPDIEQEDEAFTDTVKEETSSAEETPDDGFVEWCRSQVRGGIERRERNDIYEAYSVYGKGASGQLTCRYYHRYPEHERDFDLSSERALSFTDFNKRLLSELDKGDIHLADYNACIEQAQRLSNTAVSDGTPYEGFTDEENVILRDFCESMDTLADKEYGSGDGIFRCTCRGTVGDDTLNLWFRKPLCHDALYTDVAGISRSPIEGYDIDNLWIMGIYNRLSERCERCKVTLLTYEWSLNKETVYLMTAQGFPSIGGTLLIAVSDTVSFSRFGFYSLDFSNK